MSSKSKVCLVFVLMIQLMSSFWLLILPKLTEKIKDRTGSKPGLDYFQICHLVTLLLDKKWTILVHVEIQSLTNFWPGTTFFKKCIYAAVFVVWTNLGQILDYKIQQLSRLCPDFVQTLSSICFKMVHLWYWAMAHSPPITHSLPTWDKL